MCIERYQENLREEQWPSGVEEHWTESRGSVFQPLGARLSL